jgi:hypothetical protein
VIVRRVAGVLGVATLWYFVSEPWGLRVTELIPFAAPGALLAVGAAWIANSTTRANWTWNVARDAAIVGAALLPPILSISIAIAAPQPERMLRSSVRAAWIALVGGGIWAAATWVRERWDSRQVEATHTRHTPRLRKSA